MSTRNELIAALSGNTEWSIENETAESNQAEDLDWNETRIQLAQALVDDDTKLVPTFWQEKYEKNASKNWHDFYTRNKTNFYKDRHYLHLEFPKLLQVKSVLECGCGVGNAALPLLSLNENLKIVALDFAESAIALLQVIYH